MILQEQETAIDVGVVPDFGRDLSGDEIQQLFIEAARSIILDHGLRRAEHRWDVTALELYLYREGKWEDPTTHCAREQLKTGTWYVHRDGKLPLKRLGVDISAGSPRPETYVGLLIAAIGNRSGSGCAMKTILRGDWRNGAWQYSEQEMKLLLSEIHRKSISAGPPSLRLVRRPTPRQGPLWIGPRKLSAKVTAPYRSRDLRIQHDQLPRPAGWRCRLLEDGLD
jgi:hypothetical protein